MRNNPLGPNPGEEELFKSVMSTESHAAALAKVLGLSRGRVLKQRLEQIMQTTSGKPQEEALIYSADSPPTQFCRSPEP